jgi:mRNA interferase HigB
VKWSATSLVIEQSSYKQEKAQIAIIVAINVISKTALEQFYRVHPEAKGSLLAWHTLVTHATWTCFADVRKTVNSVDQVGEVLVFNAGDHRRIVARITYSTSRSRLYIEHVFTHPEYDAWSKRR